MRITQKLNPLLGSVTITHPFHPLHGQSYTVLKVKEINGSRRYSLLTDSGVICISESWTDRQAKPMLNLDPCIHPLDAYILKELAQLLETIDDFSKTSVDSLDIFKRER